ncbi:MAG: hypothetical protein ACOZCO_06285 [Bacteroidota bacterium]
MRKIFFVLSVVLPTLLWSQAEDLPLYFKSPQPEKEEELTQIPAAFHGVFVSQRDSLKSLHIDGDSVYTNISSLYIISLAQAKELNLEVKENYIHGLGKEPIEVIRKSDTVYFWMIQSYTFFRFDSTHAAKMADDKMMINLQHPSGQWEIILFERDYENNALNLRYIDTEKEKDKVKKMKGIKKTSVEDVKFLQASLILKDWLAYIENEGFTQKEIFRPREK